MRVRRVAVAVAVTLDPAIVAAATYSNVDAVGIARNRR
jgi:hypothetical protein